MKFTPKIFFFAGIFVLIGAFIAYMLIMFKSQENKNINIINNQEISWGVGWENARSKYSGSEFGFQINNTDSISFSVFSPNENHGQGINIFVDDQHYVFENPNVSKVNYTIKLDNPEENKKIKVMHFCSGSDKPCDLEIKKIEVDKSADIMKSELPSKIIGILGDSISVGWGRWNYSFFLTEQINYQLHNASVFGSSVVKSGEADDAISRYVEDIIEFKPDVVVIFLGSNDMAHETPIDLFKEEYLKMVDHISSESQESKIILLGNLKREGFSKEYSDIYNSAIEQIAIEKGVLYVDMYDALEFEDLQDGIHPELSAQRKLSTYIHSYIKDYLP